MTLKQPGPFDERGGLPSPLKLTKNGSLELKKKENVFRFAAKIYSMTLFHAILPGLASALSSDSIGTSDMPLVAKCALTAAIFGVLISLYIPPKITTFDTIEGPADQDKIDSVLNDIIEGKNL